MPFSPLRKNDPVVRCLRRATRLLEPLGKTDVLSNGKVEKQIKLFLAAAWLERRMRDRACVMDKKFNGRELDLLALRNGLPKFWLETKCDFREKSKEAEASARRALQQVRETRERLRDPWEGSVPLAFRDQLRSCPSYIVHFLNSTPALAKKRYGWILARYNLKDRNPSSAEAMQPEKLGRYYMERGSRPHDRRFKWISLNPTGTNKIYAVIVRFPRSRKRDRYIKPSKWRPSAHR